MSRFFSDKYEKLVPYTPGEQPKILNLTKLNTNECPFPPSQKALAFAAEHTRPLNLYSDIEGQDVRAALAELCGIGKPAARQRLGRDFEFRLHGLL